MYHIGTTQHFYSLLFIVHIQRIFHIFIGSSFQSATIQNFHFSICFFYKMSVQRAGNIEIIYNINI